MGDGVQYHLNPSLFGHAGVARLGGVDGVGGVADTEASGVGGIVDAEAGGAGGEVVAGEATDGVDVDAEVAWSILDHNASF